MASTLWQYSVSGQYPEYFAAYPSLLADIMDTARKNGFQGELSPRDSATEARNAGGVMLSIPLTRKLYGQSIRLEASFLHFGNDVSCQPGGDVISTAYSIQHNSQYC
jgi:hypothetical protein